MKTDVINQFGKYGSIDQFGRHGTYTLYIHLCAEVSVVGTNKLLVWISGVFRGFMGIYI